MCKQIRLPESGSLKGELNETSTQSPALEASRKALLKGNRPTARFGLVFHLSTYCLRLYGAPPAMVVAGLPRAPTARRAHPTLAGLLAPRPLTEHGA